MTTAIPATVGKMMKKVKVRDEIRVWSEIRVSGCVIMVLWKKEVKKDRRVVEMENVKGKKRIEMIKKWWQLAFSIPSV